MKATGLVWKEDIEVLFYEAEHSESGRVTTPNSFCTACDLDEPYGSKTEQAHNPSTSVFDSSLAQGSQDRNKSALQERRDHCGRDGNPTHTSYYAARKNEKDY